MYEERQMIQLIAEEIDEGILHGRSEETTLSSLAGKLGYSPDHVARRFREIAGMPFRDYLRARKLAFALKEVRDTDRRLLDIALDYGFSSHEAFTRAFRSVYGMPPAAYRKNPRPLALRTKLCAFDRYLLGIGEIGMAKADGQVKVYFVTLPAHKFLFLGSGESNGYWDFWQKQEALGHDCATVCGLLDSIRGKLDDEGGSDPNSGAGQIMACLHDPAGQPFCYGVPRIECYGVRLPQDYRGAVPPGMRILDVQAGDYIVFEHGPFDYEQENTSVEKRMEDAIAAFDYAGTGYRFDDAPGRIAYFYHDPKRFWKEVRPVKRAEE